MSCESLTEQIIGGLVGIAIGLTLIVVFYRFRNGRWF